MPDDKATGVINYTTTGTKTSDKFIVAGTDTLTIGVTVNTGPAVYSIDVQLQTDGKWIPEIVDAAEEMAETSTVGVIAELDRGEKTRICLSIREFQKHVYGDIRLHYRDKKDSDDWKPGKGVTLPLSKLGPLVEALRMAEDNMDQI